jgi:hypothetical protein
MWLCLGAEIASAQQHRMLTATHIRSVPHSGPLPSRVKKQELSEVVEVDDPSDAETDVPYTQTILRDSRGDQAGVHVSRPGLPRGKGVAE